MLNTEEYHHHIRSFESLMRTKGYPDHYQLVDPTTGGIKVQGALKTCLQHHLEETVIRNRPDKTLSLRTYAEFLSEDNFKECRFTGAFDLRQGFELKKLEIVSRFPDETQRLALRSNQDIPGRNAVIGRFRKPKPWDNLKRGDFKPRRRW